MIGPVTVGHDVTATLLENGEISLTIAPTSPLLAGLTADEIPAKLAELGAVVQADIDLTCLSEDPAIAEALRAMDSAHEEDRRQFDSCRRD